LSSRGVAILGSTGSIGTTALRVLARQRERFHVAALTAFTNAGLLAEQAAEFEPRTSGSCATEMKGRIPAGDRATPV
jgi:1-deoxy-D-xylulose-5-phosphate reductoisomerase